MNENERIKKIVIDFQNLIISAATGTTITPVTYQELRNDLLSEPSIRDFIPEFVITSRDLSRYWNYISIKFSTYRERRTYIWSKFDPLLRFLENENFEPVEIQVLDLLKGLKVPIINEYWKKTLERKKTDPEGAITSAKSMLESVCKHILDVHKVEYTAKDDIKTLYKKTSDSLKTNTTPKTNQTLLKIFSGCTSIIIGVSELRNNFGDAHGKGFSHSKINGNFVDFAINLSGSMTIFLIKTHLYNKKNQEK